MPHTIRKATLPDHETIYNFQIAMAQESEDVSLDPTSLSAGIRTALSDAKLGTYWVAESPSTPTSPAQVIGCLLVTTEWSDWRNGQIWWIQSVYVAPSHRRKGVYRSLYLHLENIVKSDSTVMGLRLYVEKENTSAREVYKQLGMEEHRYIVCEWLKTDY